MATDTKGIAGRLRTEAGYRRDYDEYGTLFNRRHCGFVEGVVTAFDIDDMDMHVYGLSDKLAGLIGPQSS